MQFQVTFADIAYTEDVARGRGRVGAATPGRQSPKGDKMHILNEKI
jgi:hypothetical protein